MGPGAGGKAAGATAMTEPEDYLGFTDPADRRAEQGPALISYPSLGPAELIVAEQMHRKDDVVEANKISFVMVDDETGAETLEDAAAWQRILEWPREPDVAEVQAAQVNARAARLARWWDRLAAARAEDEGAPTS